MTKEQTRVHTRWLIRRDLPEVMQISSQSFDAAAWHEEDFLHCLRPRNCIGMVGEYGEKVVSFMIYDLHSTKLHCLILAVHPEWRRRGVGEQMVAKLVGKLNLARRDRITLETRETNLAAQLFFKKQGFRAVRVLRDYYHDSGESAYLMEYRLPGVTGDAGVPVNRIANFAH